MGREILNLSDFNLTASTHDAVAPSPARQLFERARYLEGSPVLRHVPLLFWIVETCRPRLMVEIGLRGGDAYFAVCQAIDSLSLDARCCGLLSPETDPGPAQALRAYNDAHYAHFSQLVSTETTEAAGSFPDGSIDLLLVPAMKGPDPLALANEWLPKLSPRAVILLLGTNTLVADRPGRISDDPLGLSRPTVLFDQGDGVAVVLWGCEPDHQLIQFSALRFGTVAYANAHRIFARLGSAIWHDWLDTSRTCEAQELEDARHAIEDANKRNGVLSARVEWLETAYESRNQQVALLQAKLFDRQLDEVAPLQLELAQMHEKLEARSTELDSLQAERAVRFQELAVMAQLLERRACELDVLRSDLSQEAKRASELERRLSEAVSAAATPARDALEQRDKEIVRLRREADKLRQRAEKHEAEARHLKRRLSSVLDSTSWKLTAPVRRFVDAARHRTLPGSKG